MLVISFPSSQQVIQSGAITFKELNTAKGSFTVKAHTTIIPNTPVLFTDTEWNGTHFGIDEHIMTWNTGKDTIYKGELIHFQSYQSKTISSIGNTKGSLHLYSKKEAIFAYQGTDRMPTHFIAGIAHHISDYGTLQNTGLIIDSTALILH